MLSYTKTDAAFYISPPQAFHPRSPSSSTDPFACPVPSIQIIPSHQCNPSCNSKRLFERGPSYSPFLTPHVGLSAAIISSFVLTLSPGNLLTRCAPLRIAWSCIADTPLRLLRMEPASDMLSWSRKTRFGGAKSREVKVPDLRREWLVWS